MSWTKVLMEASGMFMSLKISSSLFPLSTLMFMCGGESHCITRYFWFLIGVVGRRGRGWGWWLSDWETDRSYVTDSLGRFCCWHIWLGTCSVVVILNCWHMLHCQVVCVGAEPPLLCTRTDPWRSLLGRGQHHKKAVPAWLDLLWCWSGWCCCDHLLTPFLVLELNTGYLCMSVFTISEYKYPSNHCKFKCVQLCQLLFTKVSKWCVKTSQQCSYLNLLCHFTPLVLLKCMQNAKNCITSSLEWYHLDFW